MTNHGSVAVNGAIVRVPASAGLSKTHVRCFFFTDPPLPCLADHDVPVAQAESGFAIPIWYEGHSAMIEVTSVQVVSFPATPGSATVNLTASVAAPGGVTDPTPGNNSYTLSFTTGVADTRIAITATDPAATNPLVPVVSRPAGGTAHYLVQISNNGPAAADGAILSAPATSGVGFETGVCSGPGGIQSGNPAPASLGGRLAIPSLPAGSWVNCAITARVYGAVGSWATLTVAVTAPGWIHDPAPGNNTATNTLPIK
jgi:hypothetical protein